MSHKYFISFILNKRFRRRIIGCCFMESDLPLNGCNLTEFCKSIANEAKGKNAVILYYREVTEGKEND